MKRCAKGRFQKTKSAMERFIEKCEFDPYTGCVIWTGARTRGQGHNGWYGRFHYQGRKILAHRWAAEHIHGLKLTQFEQVDHCCPIPKIPNTLCVQHLQVVSPTLNRELQWIRVQVGLEEPPEPFVEPERDIPFFEQPIWLPKPATPENPPF